MKGKVKSLHSPDIDCLETYNPDVEDSFSFLLQVFIGPENERGEESFDVIVCTPKWILQKLGENDSLFGFHHLIIQHYDYNKIVSKLNEFVDSQTGNNWDELASKYSKLGKREFDGYME